VRKAIGALVLLVLAGIILPPVYFAVVGEPGAVELPAPGRAVQLPGGVELNLLESGEGPAVVLVHGLPGCAYDWTPLAERLAAGGHRVIAYDRVGYGYSSPRGPESGYTYDQNASELLALLEALDLSGATLVGWSYGGGVVLRAGLRGPERIARLVLLGSVGPTMEIPEPGAVRRVLFSRPVLAWVSMIPPLSRALAKAASAEVFSDQPMPEWWVPQLRANLARPGTTDTWLEEEEGLTAHGLDPEPLDLPVLVIHGDDDRAVPMGVGEDLYQRAQPDAKLFRVVGGSHMIPITHAELLARQILEFSG
jgi:pimeloyl-ACP methyl ester carboxylesterase